MEMNGTTVIARPVETVFAYVNDVSNDVHWRTGVIESGLRSGGTAGVGAVGYIRVGDVEAQYRVTSFNPGESVDWELLSGPYKGRGGYRFEPVEGSTDSPWSLTSNPRASISSWGRFSPGSAVAKIKPMSRSSATSSKQCQSETARHIKISQIEQLENPAMHVIILAASKHLPNLNK